MKKLVLEYEKEKGAIEQEYRFTLFVVDGHHFLPFLQKK